MTWFSKQSPTFCRKARSRRLVHFIITSGLSTHLHQPLKNLQKVRHNLSWLLFHDSEWNPSFIQVEQLIISYWCDSQLLRQRLYNEFKETRPGSWSWDAWLLRFDGTGADRDLVLSEDWTDPWPYSTTALAATCSAVCVWLHHFPRCPEEERGQQCDPG